MPSLMVTDQQQTVLGHLARSHAYTPFGFGGRLGLAFNGEFQDITRRYLLGHGYRAFSPGLMRFVSPDSWSPFGAGGLNAYVYCLGNPVSVRDPTGHMPNGLRRLLRRSNVSNDLPSLSVVPPPNVGNLYTTPPNPIIRAGGTVAGSPENASVATVAAVGPALPPRPKATDIVKVERISTIQVTTRDGQIYRRQETVVETIGSSPTYIDAQGVERVDRAAPVIVDLSNFSDVVLPANKVSEAPPLPPRVVRIRR